MMKVKMGLCREDSCAHTAVAGSNGGIVCESSMWPITPLARSSHLREEVEVRDAPDERHPGGVIEEVFDVYPAWHGGRGCR